jgi:predicted dehydrogenase
MRSMRSPTRDKVVEVRRVNGYSLLPRQQRGGIRVAVVGCGYWGAKHVRVLSGLSNVSEIAIVDPIPKVRITIAEAFPSVRPFANLRLALPHIDAVIIATPPQTHGELAMMAIREGKHVLVEKPLTTGLREARVLVDEARSRNKVLMAGHTFLFSPAVRELRSRLVRGDLGAVCYIHTARLNLGLYRPDVNVIWDLAPHDITIMNYLLNSRPTKVGAWGRCLVRKNTEDVAFIRLDYEDLGISGYCHISWLDPRKARTVTVVGEKKMAVYDDLSEERLRIFDRGVVGHNGNSPAYERPLSYRYGDIVSPHLRSDEPLALEDQFFVDSICKGPQRQSVRLNGMIVIAILEAIGRALNSGTPANVEYPDEVDQLDSVAPDRVVVG